jgi:hypothetical protein
VAAPEVEVKKSNPIKLSAIVSAANPAANTNENAITDSTTSDETGRRL